MDKLIAENTDPEYVKFELDTFWTMRAGLNPVEVIRKFGKRIRLLHQKDFSWDRSAEKYMELYREVTEE